MGMNGHSRVTLVAVATAGVLLCASACAVGTVEYTPEGPRVRGLAVGHAKLETGRCPELQPEALPGAPTPTPAPTPAAPPADSTSAYARIEGGALSTSVVELLSTLATGAVTYFTATN